MPGITGVRPNVSLLTERAALVLRIAAIDATKCDCGHALKVHSLFRSVCEPLTGKACRCQSFREPNQLKIGARA